MCILKGAIMLCKCGSKIEYLLCCGQYIDGGLFPDTCEKLMRSRYTAYAQLNTTYIIATMRDKALTDYLLLPPEFQGIKWLKLEVVTAYLKTNDVGVVEFIAYYRYNNKKHCMHEISEFKKYDKKWYYVGEITQ